MLIFIYACMMVHTAHQSSHFITTLRSARPVNVRCNRAYFVGKKLTGHIERNSTYIAFCSKFIAIQSGGNGIAVMMVQVQRKEKEPGKERENYMWWCEAWVFHHMSLKYRWKCKQFFGANFKNLKFLKFSVFVSNTSVHMRVRCIFRVFVYAKQWTLSLSFFIYSFDSALTYQSHTP